VSKKPALAAHNILFSQHLMPFTFARDGFFTNLVKPSNYPYFAWCDRIYEVTEDGKSFRDTGVTLERNLEDDAVTLVHPT
jgi:hypothetical protein